MQQPEQPGDILFVSPKGSRLFCAPETTIKCRHAVEIPKALELLEQCLAEGCYIAGFLAYEAGWAFLDRAVPKQPPEFPLLWFGVYKDCTAVPRPLSNTTAKPLLWQPSISHEAYCRSMDRIKAYIGAGDTYQVNFTFPMETYFQDDPLQWFRQLYAAQPTEHAAYLDTGRYKVLSLSPELFFELSGEELTTRPMKGTIPRGLYPEQDEQRRLQLFESEKDRAENVMIVDLLRNDMGKISHNNSVEVASLFDVEQYATVWQMTSTIKSRTTASFTEIMKALFPSGSVTGAPKIRAMEIIDELESHPRGVYCGAVGWWSPDRTASFNVAIRTITLDTQTQQAVYPVGGGVTWYSSTAGEYAECLAKAHTVTQPSPTFSLLETMLYDDAIFLLDEHLDRLCASAAFFGIPFNREHLQEALLLYTQTLEAGYWKLRLLLHRDGTHHLEADCISNIDLTDPTDPTDLSNIKTLKVALADTPINKSNPFLYHKTTHRSVYETAKQAYPEADDVLLWNESGELTESTIANIVAELDGDLITPPVSCGLLGGVMRHHLLQSGTIRESIIQKEDLHRIRNLYLINSVRGWMGATLDP